MKYVLKVLPNSEKIAPAVTFWSPKVDLSEAGLGIMKVWYNVTSVITVASRQVEKILILTYQQGELIAKGVTLVSGDYQYNTIYEFTGLNDIKPQMIEEATANARQVAQKFAEDSKSRLGKIKKASQGQFTVTNRDSNTPYIKNVRVVTSVDYYLR